MACYPGLQMSLQLAFLLLELPKSLSSGHHNVILFIRVVVFGHRHANILIIFLRPLAFDTPRSRRCSPLS